MNNTSEEQLSHTARQAIKYIKSIDCARANHTTAHIKMRTSDHWISPYREVMRLVFELYNASEDWRANKRESLVSHDETCRKCGAAYEIMHHESYENWAMLDWELQDLVPLCQKCHTQLHRSAKGPVVPFWAARNCKTSNVLWRDVQDLYRSVEL